MAAVKGAPVIGRRNCTKCKRWRHALDFRVRARDKETGEALKLQYYCNHCHHREHAERRQRPHIKKRLRNYKRAWYRKNVAVTIGEHPRTKGEHGRNNAVSRIPIARFLKERIETTGETLYDMAQQIGVDETRLYIVVNGYSRGKGRRLKNGRYKRKLVAVDFIEIGTVDHWLQMLGESPQKLDELYPLDDAGNH